MTLQSGSLLQNRYRIDGLLGRGGMGAVYKAIDTRLGNIVAIKQNLLESTALAEQGTEHDEEWSDLRRAQFEREARLLASLRHHGLAKVTDYFFISGEGQYLVMEFVEGQDFSGILKQMGPLHEDQAIGFIIDVCDVLDYLHRQTPPVIHRDIKPANIRITPQGQVVLVDFGVAKVGTSDQTTIGARAVTPGFSPLEQFGGDLRTDERSDIYSLGATLCALLTGKAPTAATERLIDSTRSSPLEETASNLSPALKAVLAKSLELKPEERYQTARDFRAALNGLLSDKTVKQAPFDRATLIDKVTMFRPAATVASKRTSTPGSADSAPPPSDPSGPLRTGSRTAAAPPPPVVPGPPPTAQPQPGAAGSPQGATSATQAATGGFAPAEAPRRSGAPVWIWPVIGAVIALASMFFVFMGEKKPGSSKDGAPAAVVLAASPAVTANSVSLIWSPSNDEDFREYEIYFGTAPGFPITPARKYGESITNIANARAEVEGLECGTGYYFKVRTVTSSGASSVSTEMPARTAPCLSTDAAADIAENAEDSDEPVSAGTPPATGTPAADQAARTHIDPAPVSTTTGSKTPVKTPAETSAKEPPVKTPVKEPPVSTPAPTPPVSTPEPTPPPALPARIVVAPSGGTFSSVGEALEALYGAKDGVTRSLVIRPGRYVLPQRILLGRSVEIRGEGPRSSIVLEASTAQGIYVESQGGVVKGLTIQTGTSSAISVAGDAVFEDCEISAAAQSAVQVFGRGSVILRRCRLASSGGKAVFAFKGGRARLESCTIESNRGGVEAGDNSTITLTDCDVRNNTGSGVYAHDGGTVEASNCRITGNTLHGIQLKAGKVRISNCTVSGNTQFGLSCGGGPSTIFVADSDFSGNSLQGIQPTCSITRSGNVKE